MQAEKLLLDQNLDKEYAGITGVPSFIDAAGRLAYGEDSALLKDKRVSSSQSMYSVSYD